MCVTECVCDDYVYAFIKYVTICCVPPHTVN